MPDVALLRMCWYADVPLSASVVPAAATTGVRSAGKGGFDGPAVREMRVYRWRP